MVARHSRYGTAGCFKLQQQPVHLELVALGVAAEQLHSAAAIDLCGQAGVLQLLPDQVAWPPLLLPPATAPHLCPSQPPRQPQHVTAVLELQSDAHHRGPVWLSKTSYLRCDLSS